MPKNKPLKPLGRPRSLSLEQQFEVVRLVEEGHTKTEVAKQFEVSRMVIWRILKHRAPELLQKRSSK